jgi:hypothetical protein
MTYDKYDRSMHDPHHVQPDAHSKESGKKEKEKYEDKS